MLRDADTAMYKAKAAGKARYALFDTALHTEVAQRMRLEGELRRALDADEISVDYQPVFELATGHITGFEALMRWQHPTMGLIEPTTFLPVAEEAGLMVSLTDYVLRTSCRRLSAWQQRAPAHAGLRMHVNLSGVDVAHPGLVARVNSALADARLRPHDLTLELTENTLMQRLEGALPALTALRRSGVGLTVDDFGSGYSSLRHLSSLPVNGLKLAPGFVAEMERGDNESVIVHAIVLIADSLGKSIIAEGIETAGQMERLQAAGCQAGQGFYLSRPLVPQQVELLLDKLLQSTGPLPAAHRDTAHSLFH
jgi:EAL domain-containing protein (putative c-di-GMP-specific phosphodiesterase class I)